MRHEVDNSNNHWDEFHMFLGNFNQIEQRGIRKAYDFAREAHAGTKRDSGGSYFDDHVIQVAKILLTECDIVDARIIIIALLHDVVEDTNFFSDTKDYDNKTSREMSWYGIYNEYYSDQETEFGEVFASYVADGVLSISKPKIEGYHIPNKYYAYEKNRDILQEAQSDALLIKLVDRLHNGRTLGAVSEEKRTRFIEETNEFYIPLFEQRVIPYYQEVAGKFLGELSSIVGAEIKQGQKIAVAS